MVLELGSGSFNLNSNRTFNESIPSSSRVARLVYTPSDNKCQKRALRVCGVERRSGMVNPLQSFSGIERRGKKKKTRDGEPAPRKKQRRKITGGFLLSRVQKDGDTPHSGLRKIAGFNGFRHTDTAHPNRCATVDDAGKEPPPPSNQIHDKALQIDTCCGGYAAAPV
ncbi:hypothetical protein LXL04_002829 [Taraxacum kok-saghyz]